MIIGLPKEVKKDEYRVGMVPAGVAQLSLSGHKVVVEVDAGAGSGISDEEYRRAGAEVVPHASDVWQRSEMIVKVKEPQKAELPFVREGQVIFTYFHFAADRTLTEAIIGCKCVAIAYETVRDKNGRLPLAHAHERGRRADGVQEGAKCLEKPVRRAGHPAGRRAGRAAGERRDPRRRHRGHQRRQDGRRPGRRRRASSTSTSTGCATSTTSMPANVITVMSNAAQHRSTPAAGRPGHRRGAHRRARGRRGWLRARTSQMMKPGAVIVDVAIDQGGCVETSRPTTHSDPTYIVDGVVHYCVANMPGAVGRHFDLRADQRDVPVRADPRGAGVARRGDD